MSITPNVNQIAEYAEIHTHREDGLTDTVVIACAPAPDFGTVERVGPRA